MALNIVSKGKTSLVEAVVDGSEANHYAGLVQRVGACANLEEANRELQLINRATVVAAFLRGGFLCRIRDDAWHEQEGCSSMEEYLDKHGYVRSSARSDMTLYHRFVNSGITPEQVEVLGPTKARYLAPYLTAETLPKVLEIAPGKTVEQLRKYIKEVKKAGTTTLKEQSSTQVDDPLVANIVENAPDERVQRRLWFYPDDLKIYDEAVAKARSETGSQYDSQAVVAICMDYLAGPSTPSLEKESDTH